MADDTRNFERSGGAHADAPLIVPHDPGWARRADALALHLRAAAGDVARRIEHIGSTAIPGMAAKDVLDIQVSVTDFRTAQELDGPLAALGFEPRPYLRDHVPAAGTTIPPAGRSVCGPDGDIRTGTPICTLALAVARENGWPCCSATGFAPIPRR